MPIEIVTRLTMEDTVTAALRNYQSMLDELNGKAVDTRIGVDDKATPELEKIKGELVDLDSKDYTVRVGPTGLDRMSPELNNAQQSIQRYGNTVRAPLDQVTEGFNANTGGARVLGRSLTLLGGVFGSFGISIGPMLSFLYLLIRGLEGSAAAAGVSSTVLGKDTLATVDLTLAKRALNAAIAEEIPGRTAEIVSTENSTKAIQDEIAAIAARNAARAEELHNLTAKDVEKQTGGAIKAENMLPIIKKGWAKVTQGLSEDKIKTILDTSLALKDENSELSASEDLWGTNTLSIEQAAAAAELHMKILKQNITTTKEVTSETTKYSKELLESTQKRDKTKFFSWDPPTNMQEWTKALKSVALAAAPVIVAYAIIKGSLNYLEEAWKKQEEELRKSIEEGVKLHQEYADSAVRMQERILRSQGRGAEADIYKIAADRDKARVDEMKTNTERMAKLQEGPGSPAWIKEKQKIVFGLDKFGADKLGFSKENAAYLFSLGASGMPSLDDNTKTLYYQQIEAETIRHNAELVLIEQQAAEERKAIAIKVSNDLYRSTKDGSDERLLISLSGIEKDRAQIKMDMENKVLDARDANASAEEIDRVWRDAHATYVAQYHKIDEDYAAKKEEMVQQQLADAIDMQAKISSYLIKGAMNRELAAVDEEAALLAGEENGMQILEEAEKRKLEIRAKYANKTWEEETNNQDKLLKSQYNIQQLLLEASGQTAEAKIAQVKSQYDREIAEAKAAGKLEVAASLRTEEALEIAKAKRDAKKDKLFQTSIVGLTELNDKISTAENKDKDKVLTKTAENTQATAKNTDDIAKTLKDVRTCLEAIEKNKSVIRK